MKVKSIVLLASGIFTSFAMLSAMEQTYYTKVFLFDMSNSKTLARSIWRHYLNHKQDADCIADDLKNALSEQNLSLSALDTHGDDTDSDLLYLIYRHLYSSEDNHAVIGIILRAAGQDAAPLVSTHLQGQSCVSIYPNDFDIRSAEALVQSIISYNVPSSTIAIALARYLHYINEPHYTTSSSNSDNDCLQAHENKSQSISLSNAQSTSSSDYDSCDSISPLDFDLYHNASQPEKSLLNIRRTSDEANILVHVISLTPAEISISDRIKCCEVIFFVASDSTKKLIRELVDKTENLEALDSIFRQKEYDKISLAMLRYMNWYKIPVTIKEENYVYFYDVNSYDLSELMQKIKMRDAKLGQDRALVVILEFLQSSYAQRGEFEAWLELEYSKS